MIFLGIKQLFLFVVGRLCQTKETTASFRILERCGSFNEFKTSLSKTCQNGQPGVLRWTPDKSTPDLVYYQVRKGKLGGGGAKTIIKAYYNYTITLSIQD